VQLVVEQEAQLNSGCIALMSWHVLLSQNTDVCQDNLVNMVQEEHTGFLLS
jgi:hypothetical protein